MVLLATHEGSRADWIRKLLEVATGFHAGIQDKQKQMELSLNSKPVDHYDKLRNDANHDMDDGTQILTVIDKSFDQDRSTALLYLRNPFEALVGAMAEKDMYLEGSTLVGPLWDSQVRQKTYTWFARAKTWLCSAQTLQIIHYENLKNDISNELLKVLDFLDFKVNGVNLKCAAQHGMTDLDPLDMIIKKKGQKLKFPYGSTQARSLESAICSVNWLLMNKGYEGLPLEAYVQDLEKHFEGPFIPSFLCQSHVDFEKVTC